MRLPPWPPRFSGPRWVWRLCRCRGELPADVGRFTGRAVELAELDLLLPDAIEDEGSGPPGPVVISAVSGTAGVGKTALAVRWAHRVATTFPDGQLYVNLRGYDPDRPMSAAEALAGFLRTLGVAGQDIPLEEAERAARYRSLVAGRRLLVVLDNAASVEQVRPLLPGTESVMVVVTSRDSLAGLVARDGAHRSGSGSGPAACRRCGGAAAGPDRRAGRGRPCGGGGAGRVVCPAAAGVAGGGRAGRFPAGRATIRAGRRAVRRGKPAGAAGCGRRSAWRGGQRVLLVLPAPRRRCGADVPAAGPAPGPGLGPSRGRRAGRRQHGRGRAATSRAGSGALDPAGRAGPLRHA